MNLTLALPSLCRNVSDGLNGLDLPSLNNMLRFGVFAAEAAEPSAFYGRFLWHGSLLDCAKQAVGVPQGRAAVLASPVWQRMGMNSMDMLDGGSLGIGQHEAEAFCGGLNGFFGGDGWYFYAVRPDLWLAALPEAPGWQVPPVLDVLGRADGSVRAEGGGSGGWLRAQTEIQMWLHAHPLNEKRLGAGLPAVNGVWLWRDAQGGLGRNEPPVLGSGSPWAQFYPGTHAGAPADYDEWLALWRQSGNGLSDGLLFLDDLAATRHTDDPWEYREILEGWERRWFAPIWRDLRAGRLGGLRIATDGEYGGVLSVKAGAGRAFWKKRKVFEGRLF